MQEQSPAWLSLEYKPWTPNKLPSGGKFIERTTKTLAVKSSSNNIDTQGCSVQLTIPKSHPAQRYSMVELLCFLNRSRRSLLPALTSTNCAGSAAFASPAKGPRLLCASLARQPGGMPGTPFGTAPKPGGIPGTPRVLRASAYFSPTSVSLTSGGTLADLRSRRPASGLLLRVAFTRCFRASARSCSTCASERRRWLHVRAAWNHSASFCVRPCLSSSESTRVIGGRGGRKA